MKILILAVLVVIACAVMFLTGMFSPPKSRRLQRRVDKTLLRGEAKGDRSGRRVGQVTSDSLDKGRKAIDRSAAKGREVHDRVTRND